MTHVPTNQRKRRLTAIMFTDVAGYSALAEENEDLALELLEEHNDLVRRAIRRFSGHEVKTIGDAFLIEFPSVIDALSFGIEVQSSLRARNEREQGVRKLNIRIGLHVGEVVDTGNDMFGDDVNVAARVERLAPVGGIAVTQAVIDHAGEDGNFDFEDLGTKSLKNIKKQYRVHRVVMPWENLEPMPRLARFMRTLLNHAPTIKTSSRLAKARTASLRVATFATATMALGFVALASIYGIRQSAHQDLSAKVQHLELNGMWEYAEQPEPGKVEAWQTFILANADFFAGRVANEYMLRKSFTLPSDWTVDRPAIVLGLIGSSHEVTLNGWLVGGGSNLGDLQYYQFDPVLLKPGAENVLTVRAKMRNSLLSPIKTLPHVGTFVGPEAVVRDAVMRDKIYFHTARTVYLGVGLIFFTAFYTYFLVHRRRKEYLYLALFLLGGCLLLMYYQPAMFSILPFAMFRLLKISAIALMGFMAASAVARVSGWARAESLNNVLWVLCLSGLALSLLSQADNPLQLQQRLTYGFGALLAYNVLWLALATAGATLMAWRRRHIGLMAYPQLYQLAIGACGWFVIAAIVSSHRPLQEWLNLSDEFNGLLSDVAMASPIVCASILLVAIFSEYITASRRVEDSRSREELIVNISRAISQSTNFGATVNAVQQKVASFIGALRSTVYLTETEAHETFLKARFVYGDMSSTQMVRNRVVPDTGPIAWVFDQREPLLIRDIGADFRFQQHVNKRQEKSGYKSGSCMLFPLVVRGDMIGVLTVADRADGQAFSDADFRLMQNVAKDLALLLNVARLGRQLQEQRDGLVHALAQVIEMHHPGLTSKGHGVAYIVAQIAEQVGLHDQVDQLRIAGELHNLGKIAVPRQVLGKPTNLSERERIRIEQHPRYAYEILNAIPGFQMIADWIVRQNERLDGTGYPSARDSQTIGREAQILGIAAIIDAMASARPYRTPLDLTEINKVLSELGREQKIEQDIVDAARNLLATAGFRDRYSDRFDASHSEGDRENLARSFFVGQLQESKAWLKALEEYLQNPNSAEWHDLDRDQLQVIQELLTQLSKSMVRDQDHAA